MNTNKIPLENRYWAKVIKTETCWLWVGAKKGRGYGHIWLNGHMMGAHRVVWIIAYGEIPEGMCVLHTCDTENCVKPDHLFLGTPHDNSLDMVAKRRCRYGEACYNTKLTDKQVLEIRNSPLRNARLAETHCVSFQHISRIKKGSRRMLCNQGGLA